MYISPIFKDKTIGELEALWSDVFDPGDMDVEDTAEYQKLMVKTFPILYKAWTDPSGMVSREIATLLCTFRRVFESCYDDEGNFLCNEVFEVAAAFHLDFIHAFIFQDVFLSFELTDDGIIRIESDDMQWEVDSKTFDLPDDFPWKD